MPIDISHLPVPGEDQNSVIPTSSGVDISHLPAPEEQSTTPKSDAISNKLSNILGTYLKYNPGTAIPSAIYRNSPDVQDYATGLQEGGTLGFRDEALGALKGAGKTALEGITGELPENKSTLEELHDNYRKYQKQAQDEQDAAHSHGYSAAAGKLVGGFATGGQVFGAAKNLNLAGRTLLGAGLGGTTGAGESKGNLDTDDGADQLTKDTAIGTGLGALSVPVSEGAIKYGVTPAINKVMNKLSDSSGAKQLAAAVQNASKGGTIFGEQGPKAIETQNNALANDTADKITKGISEKNADFTNAFKKAAEEGRTLEKPSNKMMNSLTDLSDELKTSNVRLGDQDAQTLNDLYHGEVTPDKANALIQSLKTKRYEAFGNDNLKNALTNSIEDLEQAANKTLDSTTLQNLNAAKHEAWNQVEPFIQKAQDVIPDKAFQPKDASSLTPQQMNLKIRGLIKSLAENSGNSTGTGTSAQVNIGELQNALQNSGQNTKFPGVNPAEIASNIQNQGYLNAAKDAAQGIQRNTSLGAKDINPFIAFKDKGLLWSAEKLSGSKVAKDVSSKLLSNDPAQMLENAKRLSSIPKTAALAKQYYDAAQVGNSQKLTNTIFQIMQNPDAKKAISDGVGNAVSNIPGVVNSDKEK